MSRFWLAIAANLLAGGILFAAEVQVQVKPSPTKAPPSSDGKSPSPTATVNQQLPQYRPALLGLGPDSVINRMDTATLIKNGQKDGSLFFCCSVGKGGEINDTWTYRVSPGSEPLERELVRCLDRSRFIPAIYNRQPVYALFFGTVIFKVVNEKPRLRIFANQEAEELKKESDFIGPQPFVGPGSKFEGLHYPADTITSELKGIVDLALKVDATGAMKELRVVQEDPPLVGFGRAAAEDFRVASFIPAFRDGKPVECSVTLPIYYEP
jgi:hypothetical protein